jgi:hypothetical protein
MKITDKYDINWSEVTDKEEVIELIKKRDEIEEKIMKLDDKAILKYELLLLDIMK